MVVRKENALQVVLVVLVALFAVYVLLAVRKGMMLSGEASSTMLQPSKIQIQGVFALDFLSSKNWRTVLLRILIVLIMLFCIIYYKLAEQKHSRKS